ncbi:MAG: hypothetical protein ABIG63_05945 [Chloroflexota bacterium]
MSKTPKIQLERLPKRDAVARLRAVYACLERSWQVCRCAADRQRTAQPEKEEAS